MKVKTSALVLKVKAVARPPGAENALASTKLTLAQRVTPQQLGGLRVGDAVTRTITTSADGVRGMFLPPVEWKPIEGLAVYPKAADVQDLSEQHAGFVGSRRTDSVTYVVQRAGEYELPAVEVSWWNTRSGAMQKTTVPAVKFAAAANPAYKPEFGLPSEAEPVVAPKRSFDWRKAAAWSALGLVGLFAVWVVWSWLAVLVRSIVRWLRARRARYLASETAAFAALERSCRRRDAAACHRALLVWIGRFRLFDARIGLDRFRELAADPVLTEQLALLESGLYGSATAERWKAGVLLARLRAARRRLLGEAERRRAEKALPSLNPY